MSDRRFRPKLYPLPDRITPSGFSTTITMTAPSSTSPITEATTQMSYPTITCCQLVEPGNFLD